MNEDGSTAESMLGPIPWDDFPTDNLFDIILWEFGFPKTLKSRLLGPPRPTRCIPSEPEVRLFATRMVAFVKAARRFVEVVDHLGRLDIPTPEQAGTAIDSLLLHASGLYDRFKQLDECEPIISEIRGSSTRQSHLYVGQLTQSLAVPDWIMPESDGLTRNARSVAIACLRVWCDAAWMEEEGADTWPCLRNIYAESCQNAIPSLDGEDGLLKGLPRLQEEISGRIYREEFLSDG